MEMRRERYLTVVECFAPGDIFGLDDDQIKRESVVGTGCLYQPRLEQPFTVVYRD